MRLESIYSNIEKSKEISSGNKPVISFEVFPPKDNIFEKNKAIIDELKILSKFSPSLVSITYGAGGTTEANSLELAKLIKNELSVDVMPHLTCKNSSKEFIKKYIEEIENDGIENVLALRGDSPIENVEDCSDFKYANELVSFIRARSDLSIAVAGYPECHIECDSIDKDIENLKRKVDAGASVIYTQLFFNNDYYYKYVDKVRSAGINLPVVPGILPITSYGQLNKMTSLCNVSVPDDFKYKIEKFKNDSTAISEIGLNFAINQTKTLILYGVPGVHFYILNKSKPTYLILENIL